MIDFTTADPALKELFNAFDNLLRASQPNGDNREHYLEWTAYHWKRFRNALGRRPEHEQETWTQLRAMVQALTAETNVDADGFGDQWCKICGQDVGCEHTMTQCVHHRAGMYDDCSAIDPPIDKKEWCAWCLAQG